MAPTTTEYITQSRLSTKPEQELHNHEAHPPDYLTMIFKNVCVMESQIRRLIHLIGIYYVSTLLQRLNTCSWEYYVHLALVR